MDPLKALDKMAPSLRGIQEESHVEADDHSFSSSPEQERAPTTSAKQNAEDQILDAKQSRAVTWLRVGLAMVLLIATVLVSLSIYYYTSSVEQDDFENAFRDSSAKILEAFSGVAESRLGAIDTFSTSITAHAMAVTKASNGTQTWPFITVPQYQAQVDHLLSLAAVDQISFCVVVDPQDRQEWEQDFVPNNLMDWVQESIEYANYTSSGGGGPPSLSPDEDYPGKPTTGPGGVAMEIVSRAALPNGKRGSVIAEDTGDSHLVWWQLAPYDPWSLKTWINLDLNNDKTFDGSISSILKRSRVALGPMATDSYGATAEGPPISGFYYPVMDKLTHNNEGAKVAGALVSLFVWESFFADILPQNVNGLVAVLRNTPCDQAFTFMINGPDVEFLGEGDLHDQAYNNMMDEVMLTSLISQRVDDGAYKGFELDDEGCQYFLQVYASSSMEDDYISNMPIYYTMGAICIFAMASLIFFIYDRLVERRQRLTMKEALKSGAIVSSLFPEEFKKKLMEEKERELDEQKKTQKGNHMQSSDMMSKKLSNVMAGGTDEDDLFAVSQVEEMADLYPDCTILFADIAGFTQWSSKHTPSEVFQLLQMVFGRFDRVASRRGVFKVETIGDCYLAVTGLPNKQENHALIMAKFANECLVKMNETTRNLVDVLGEDTAELTLRVGIHSGPITGGILRGAKSRFQVFGDTVNTGSRMESTGESNRVQVSPTTAELLREKHGKGHWLQPRADKVEAKGKGMMQTFWLVPESTMSKAGSSFTTFSTFSSSPSSRAYPAELYKEENDEEQP